MFAVYLLASLKFAGRKGFLSMLCIALIFFGGFWLGVHKWFGLGGIVSETARTSIALLFLALALSRAVGGGE